MSVLTSLKRIIVTRRNTYCHLKKGYVNFWTRIQKSDRLNGKMNDINENISFTDYDCIGFDLDNTICRYKVTNMMNMEYETLSRYLVENKGYSDVHLLRPMEQYKDLILKGLIMDFKRGNVLKIAADGKILQANHGTRSMSQTEIETCYGKDCHWDVTDQFCRDPLIAWNGPLSEQMRSLVDYFDMPAGLAFACAVDDLDKRSGNAQVEYNIWPDILDGLIHMYDRDHFRLNKGDYFSKMKASPEMYIHKCSEQLLNWLKLLKKNNKKLFLITGSHMDFASLTASTCMGEQWRDLFDIVVFFAKKPGFFTGERPFLTIVNNEEGNRVSGEELRVNESYSQGNWTDLYGFLSRITAKQKPKVLYIGDNLLQDVYTPAIHAQLDTVAIVEELTAEGMYGFGKEHDDNSMLASQHWGSFFTHCAMDSTDSIWKYIIDRYSKLCIPTLNHIAGYSLDKKFNKQL